MKKKYKKLIRKLILLLIIVGIGLGSYKLYKHFNNDSDSSAFKITQSKDNKVKETWPKVEKVSLIAGGDTVVHDQVAAFAKKSDDTYDFNPYFTEIKDMISSYDIAYYNQETTLGGKELGYTFYPMFNTPTEFGQAMVNTGFNMVSLANNHSYDRGEKAVINSVNFWNSQNDVMTNGMALSDDERTNYQIMTKNGISYAMLSYTYGLNGFKLPNGKDYLVNVYSDELVKKDIEAIRDKVDVLIVAMHWGVEYTHNPTNTQKTQAKYLASLGVDVIIGNHPHCIQPVEWIDNTLVIYSLGNLISNQVILVPKYGQKVAIGAFATMDFIKTTNEDGTKNIKIDNLEIELSYTYKNTAEKYYKVIPFSKMNTKYLSNYEEIYNEFKNVIQKFDNNIKVKPSA